MKRMLIIIVVALSLLYLTACDAESSVESGAKPPDTTISSTIAASNETQGNDQQNVDIHTETSSNAEPTTAPKKPATAVTTDNSNPDKSQVTADEVVKDLSNDPYFWHGIFAREPDDLEFAITGLNVSTRETSKKDYDKLFLSVTAQCPESIFEGPVVAMYHYKKSEGKYVYYSCTCPSDMRYYVPTASPTEEFAKKFYYEEIEPNYTFGKGELITLTINETTENDRYIIAYTYKYQEEENCLTTVIQYHSCVLSYGMWTISHGSQGSEVYQEYQYDIPEITQQDISDAIGENVDKFFGQYVVNSGKVVVDKYDKFYVCVNNCRVEGYGCFDASNVTVSLEMYYDYDKSNTWICYSCNVSGDLQMDLPENVEITEGGYNHRLITASFSPVIKYDNAREELYVTAEIADPHQNGGEDPVEHTMRFDEMQAISETGYHYYLCDDTYYIYFDENMNLMAFIYNMD